MQSYRNFSQIFTQFSQVFSSVESKTKSLKLVDVNYLSEEEFLVKLQQMSIEIPLFETILKYKDLFTLAIQPQLILSILVQNWIGDENSKEIGVGANAKVFANYYEHEKLAVKTMENININMLEFYIQECINQYELIKVNKEIVLNFKGLVYINIFNNQASIYIPLELAEYSLFDYIQNNEITQEIYQYFYNLLIDMLVLLHSNNYAHRDIKPQNILFIKGQGWKLADFGESIKYEQRQDLYKIQGTVAFLPLEIRKQVNNKHKQIYQDLFKNDLYAVICTLVMIKNPQFKPRDLINYMDTQEFDKNIQQLYQIFKDEQSQTQLLESIKLFKQQMNLELYKTNINISISPQYSIWKVLQASYLFSLPMNQDLIICMDDMLFSLQEENKLDEQQKLQFYLILLFPFQVHQLKNFNSQQLNHRKIIKNREYYLRNDFIKHIYFNTISQDCEFIQNITCKAIYQKNVFVIFNLIKYFIRIGNFKLADNLLQIVDKIMLNDINFDSNLFFVYNLFYMQIHDKALSFDENYIKQGYPKILQYQKIWQNDNQFNLEQYLNLDKFINKDTVNLIVLLYPLFHQFEMNQSTLNVVCRHIIEILDLNEFLIVDDKFALSNVIKQQLIKGGQLRYMNYQYQIISGITKLFLNYDVFEGLLDLLQYFLRILKYIDQFQYNQTLAIIQKLVFLLNIPKYHIKEDFNIEIHIDQKQCKTQHLRHFQLALMVQQNQLLFNIIQDQQKTDKPKINLQLQHLKIIFTQDQIRKSYMILKEEKIYQSIKEYALLYSYLQSQNQQNLSVLVLIYRYLCGDSIDQKQLTFQINKEAIKFQFDPILLPFYIQSKQNNRITLLNLWKTYKNLDLMITLEPYFLYRQCLGRFLFNEKYRYLFNFKQHLFVGNIYKPVQKRLKNKINNISLKEQFLGV